MRPSALATLLILFSTNVNADAILTTLHKESGKAALTFYNGGCGEDNLVECEVAQLSCLREDPIVVEWSGFNDLELASWLSKSKGAAAIVTDKGAFMLRMYKIEYSDMNANWDVSLTSDAASQDIWRTLPRSRRVSIANADRSLHLTVNEHMAQVSEVCRAEDVIPQTNIVAQQNTTLEIDAISFATRHALAESSPAALAIRAVSPHYGDVVSYYGKEISRGELLRDYLAFVKRWPERSYYIRPGSIEAQCIRGPDICNVNAILDWVAVSQKRGKRSEGQGTWVLTVKRIGGSFAITSVNGSVLARNISDVSLTSQVEARVP